MLASVAAIAFLLSTTTTALAQGNEPASSPPSIRVVGEATVRVAPDEARIEVGVLSTGDTAKAAASANARQVGSVIPEIRKILGTHGELRTMGFTVAPTYRYPKEGGKPTITGYTVTNTVEVRTTDLDQVGNIIDIATQTGSNVIQRLQFTVRDTTAAQSTALRQASEAARSKAQAIGASLGVRIVRVLHAEESSSVAEPVHQRMFAAASPAEGAPTPVEPGTIEMRATVILTMEIAQ